MESAIANDTLRNEAKRLHDLLARTGYEYEDCLAIAPLTLDINRLKRAKNALVLAHHYMTPDIVYGIADYAEDALGLVRRAVESNADIVIACGVVSLAQMIKLGAPEKTVICPNMQAGCSVADSITAEQVLDLKRAYPGVPTVAYVTTSAEVKAVSDYIVTSATARSVISRIADHRIIFYPDKAVGTTLKEELGKDLIVWDGTCIVHGQYTLEQVVNFRKHNPDAAVLFHSEVDPSLYTHGDMHGGTAAMKKYVSEHPEVDKFFLVTECGLSDQLRVEYPGKKFIGTCSLCPYMKTINLENALAALLGKLPTSHTIEFAPDIWAGIQSAYHRTEALLRQ